MPLFLFIHTLDIFTELPQWVVSIAQDRLQSGSLIFDLDGQ